MEIVSIYQKFLFKKPWIREFLKWLKDIQRLKKSEKESRLKLSKSQTQTLGELIELY